MTGHKNYEIERLLEPEHWFSICPDMSITENDPLSHGSSFGEQILIRDGDWEECKVMIHEDGYFAYQSWFHPAFMDRLAKCMRQIDDAGLDPVFCFVFDEFWELLLQLNPLLSDLIGDYEILPAVWAWFVKPDNQCAFAPHRDGVRDVSVDDEEHLDYLTIWIPLTNIDHRSSCISVLPASLDADYDAGTSDVRIHDSQDVRSLQGQKGSVFCWTIGLAHWGTRQSRFGDPRMSVGYFVQNPDAECLVPPPIDFDSAFSLRQRLSLIGRQIIDYSRNADEEQLEFARHLTRLSIPDTSRD